MFPNPFFSSDYFAPEYFQRPSGTAPPPTPTGHGFRGAGRRYLQAMMLEQFAQGQRREHERMIAVQQLSQRLASRQRLFDMETVHQKKLTEAAMFTVLLSEI